jgi:hypothetical protein
MGETLRAGAVGLVVGVVLAPLALAIWAGVLVAHEAMRRSM